MYAYDFRELDIEYCQDFLQSLLPNPTVVLSMACVYLKSIVEAHCARFGLRTNQEFKEATFTFLPCGFSQ
jgi:hypothetical protein